MLIKRIAPVFLLLFCSATWAEPRLLRVCEADTDYPPFGYYVDKPGQTRQLHGFSIRLLRRILAASDYSIELISVPFSRCLRGSADLSLADMILTASITREREKDFLASSPFWFVRFHAFYAKTSFPNGLPLSGKKDLSRFRLCGIRGHNFSMFGIKDDQIDLGADSYEAVFKKVARGRCEVFPYNLDVIESYELIGKNLLQSGEVVHQAITDVPDWPIQMLIARRYPHALVLQNTLNDALEAMNRSGELRRLYQENLAQMSAGN